jgi:hypothetical protein
MIKHARGMARPRSNRAAVNVIKIRIIKMSVLFNVLSLNIRAAAFIAVTTEKNGFLLHFTQRCKS